MSRVRSFAAWFQARVKSARSQACFPPWLSMPGDFDRTTGLPGEAEDSPARSVVLSLSYRHIAYLLDSERVGTAKHLWLDRSDAGAAAYGTTVLASAGGLNRTFVLLFLNSHLNVWPSGGADGESIRKRAGGALTMERSNLTHLWRGAIPLQSVAPPPSVKQEPWLGIKVAPNTGEPPSISTRPGTPLFPRFPISPRFK